MCTYSALHRHTTYSIYDGFQTPEQGAKYAAQLGYKALAITDHGNFNGAVDHYKACKKYGIHPVIGCEGYFQPAFDEVKRDYHMTILCKNMTGYQHLCQMVSYANMHQWAHRHGVITFPLLKKYHEGLIITTGCIGGIIPQHILKGKMQSVHALMQTFIKVFGDDFVVEVMPFPVMEDEDESVDGEHVLGGEDDDSIEPIMKNPSRNIQKEVNEVLLQLAEQYNRRVIMTDDAHYVSQEDYESYLFMQEKVAGKVLIANYENLYLHSTEGMEQAWREMMGTDGSAYIQNATDLALSCQVELDFDEKQMIPKIDWGMPSSEKIRQVVQEALVAMGKWTEVYQKRIEDELDVVLYLGFEDYFLLCWDLVQFAKRSNIAMGYGRGSVCNSLLGYALGLTQVDPILLDTDFERFLRKDKRAMPDVDMDYDPRRREEIISYLVQRFNGSAYQISNYTYYKSKLLVNDMAKHFFDISKEDVEALKEGLDAIDYDAGKEDGGGHYSYEDLLEHKVFREFDADYPGFLEQFTRLYGEIKNVGKHAAGIALTPDDITKYVPIVRVGAKGSEQYQTGYNMAALSDIHVLKIDALGLIQVAIIREVEQVTGCSFSYDILNDPRIYEEMAAARTDTVFQFSSIGMRDFVHRAKPSCFDDVVSCNALFRPGAMKNIDAYIQGKFGGKRKHDPHLDQFFEKTYGVLVFDEQKLRIARHAGHMEWEDVDKLMKQAKKGKIDDTLRAKFVKGATEKSGFTLEEAKKLIEMMSKYSFNRGHAVGYSLLACYTLWLRIHYPLEYYCATLRLKNDKDDRAYIEASAIYSGVPIVLPHINGYANYEVDHEGEHPAIHAGLQGIPNVGQKAIVALMKIREEGGYFLSEEDFLTRIQPYKRVINKRVVDALRSHGALEFDMDVFGRRCLEYTRRMYDSALQIRRKQEWKFAQGQKQTVRKKKAAA